MLAVGTRVEVWFAGWDQWAGGSVEMVGFISGVPCAQVLLDGDDKASVWRLDQCRAQEGLFAL